MDVPGGLTLEQLSLIYNNTHDLIFLIGVEADGYRTVSVNRRYLEQSGLTEEQFVDRRIEEVFSPAEAEYLKERYGAAITNGGPIHYETLAAIDGRQLYLDTTLVPVFEADSCRYIIGVSRDITAGKLESKALAKEKRRAERYLNIAQAIIIALDADARVLLVNRKGYDLLGYPEGSLTGTNWMDLLADEERREEYLHAYQTVISGENEATSITVKIRTYDGDVRLISWSSSPIHDDAGVIIGLLSSGEDITEQKKAQEAMIATQRIAAAGEVVSAVAHDFNNALQGILGNIELAMLDEHLAATVKDYLETASSLASDAAQRIRLLQRLASTESSTVEDEVLIAGLLDEVVAQTRHLWLDEVQRLGRVIDVRQAVAPDLRVKGSASELRMAFYNIMKNAIEALPEGGVINVTAQADVDQQQVIVKVADNGIGMDEDTVERLFQPFYSTKGFEVGRGLGMSAVHTIITAHGGGVRVARTSRAEGTEIEISLPLVTSDNVEQENNKDVMKILWVDDDPAIRRLAEKIIERLGHEGRVAESGDAALLLLAQSRYDVVISDIGMPGMNGYELSARVGEMTGGDIPVIALTGWGESVSEADRQRYGISMILAKPISLASLQEVLASLLTESDS